MQKLNIFFLFQKKSVTLRPIMRSSCFKYCIMFLLLVIYINRGLFVAMPGVEISCMSNEINSLLEVVINLAGEQNDIDEDGDSPENYGVAKILQPLIDQNATDVCTACPFAVVCKIFYMFDELMLPPDAYGTIDHPPKIA